MGLINWLKQKIFHKKDEDKKEGKPVEPVVEENLKSEEAKDKTSGESVVEKTLEGNKVDEEPIYEVKKEETKEEYLQPEVVKEEQSVEQSIEDKVETKEEPVVEENTLEESVQPEVKEEQKIEEQPIEENKVEDNSSIKDEEKYEPSKGNEQSSFEEPVVEENTLEESVQPEVKEEQKIEEQPIEENKVEDNSSIKDEEKYEPSKGNEQSSFEEPVVEENTLEESVQPEVKEEQKIEEQPIEENKVEDNSSIKDEEKYEPSKGNEQSSFEEPVVEENTLEESVQPEVKEEQKIEEQPIEENKVEDNSSIKDEEKYEPSKGNEQSSFEEPVIQNNTDGIENNNEFEYSNPLLDLVLEDKLEKKESKVEVNDEQPIEDKAETKEEPIVEKELSDEPVQPEIKEEQHAEENKAEEKENEEDEDEVIEEKEEQTKEAELVNSADEPVIEKKNDEATTKKVEVDHETKIYNLGLAKSREGFGARLNSIANKYKEANSEYFDDLERCLIEADVGVNLTMSVLDETEKMAASQHLDNPKEINDLLVDNLFMNYAKSGDSFQTEIKFDPENPTVLLMVGVNGTGKTTTIAKLAKHYKELGKKVLLVAADTFRAGAVQQLSIWANRIGVDIFERGQGADPASVCFDAVKKAINDKYDLVMVDTAGRLHTKDYLMAELGKVNRVIKKVLPVAPQEIWLALDANTGQNGVQQAKVFKEVTPLTGVVITKMDGTSKGGIILAIRDQLGVPVRFIGLGEHEDDLREFDLDRYLYALLVGEDENSEE